MNSISKSIFQSHFGLILIKFKKLYGVVDKLISIPFWSDFNAAICFVIAFVDHISIPFWSDFNLRVVYDEMENNKFQSHFGLILMITDKISIAAERFISIPFWSDFNTVIRGAWMGLGP